MEEEIAPMIGMVLRGYCNGYFGRGSYCDKHIEFVAYDYIIIREDGDPALFSTKEWSGNILKQWLEDEEKYD